MGRINVGRVVLGGLLAGLVIDISEALLNGVVFAKEMDAMMAALNKPPIDGSMITLFVLLGFCLGVVLIWLYAAMRPRLGPGVRTAVVAGLTVWGLVELVVAATAGAWMYKET